ncbi:uncharacterized protein A1O5_11132 [Cladophialophora psammophila CBS 110553]|uniref:Uncharacterized protein n=1 Tax=Cladophialophora psammophila CBS 110553 TaxID=1182543 RepID=W9WKT3_9EURO|nr:uncharacterized protein A1O5_11132 [Cladophialophora psammophila CBS 110553]EXJ65605.1 hypothetical protein A1O5_11132 [Cladophialophora psammophila CBS 110553]
MARISLASLKETLAASETGSEKCHNPTPNSSSGSPESHWSWGRYPYRLDMKKDNYEFLVNYMGLKKYIDYSHSSSTTFDIIPTHYECKGWGFYGSIFLVHFIGLHITHDVRIGQTRSLGWTGDKQMPRFQDCLMRLGSLAQHPYCILLSAAASFNSHHNFRLGEVSRDVSSVEKRKGYSGWDMMLH